MENTERQETSLVLQQQIIKGSYSKKLPSGGVWASVHGNLVYVHIKNIL